MESIKFGVNNYQSRYGKESLQTRTAKTTVASDSYTPTYKKKHKTAKSLATVGLLVVGAFVALKNKSAVSDIAKTLKEKFPKFKAKGENVVEDIAKDVAKDVSENATKEAAENVTKEATESVTKNVTEAAKKGFNSAVSGAKDLGKKVTNFFSKKD
jgi:glycyl-tRNA synthetase beta subunit